jgi:DNA-directed RNA polymerase subunit RPC12/RpoP
MMFSRKIRCKECGLRGVIEAHDTQHYPVNDIFRHLGKDAKGFLHFKCPYCGADEPYSPYSFFNPIIKLVLGALLVLLVLIVWFFLKLIL